MWKNGLFTMWFLDFVTVFNQSYNCQTSHYLGRNRLPEPLLLLLSLGMALSVCSWWGTTPWSSFWTLLTSKVNGCMTGGNSWPLTPAWQRPEKQISVKGGLGPGHSWSGNTATVLENSKKILHSTFRSRIPSPHGELQSPHSSTIKLCMKKGEFINVTI